MRRSVPRVVPSHLIGGGKHGGARAVNTLIRAYVYAVYRPGDPEAPKSSDPYTGILCDVLPIEPGYRGLLRNVPIMTQSGGAADTEHWEPTPISARLDGSELSLEGQGASPLHETDGDLVIVAFLGGDAFRPIIVGQLPHPGTANPAQDLDGYRWWRKLAGGIASVADDGGLAVDLRETEGQKLTLQTTETTIDVDAGTTTVTTGGTTIVIDDGVVTITGADTTITGGRVVSRSSAVAPTQPVVLAQAHADILATINTIGEWFATSGVVLSGLGLVVPPPLVSDLVKLNLQLRHLATNTESD